MAFSDNLAKSDGQTMHLAEEAGRCEDEESLKVF